MGPSDLEAIGHEIRTLRDVIRSLRGRARVRDRGVRDRVVTLYRVWTTVGKFAAAAVEEREALKLDAELEALAQLTSREREAQEYAKRLARADRLISQIVMRLPAPAFSSVAHGEPGERLFIPTIPDLPLELVPNAILGWKSRMAEFIEEHPFGSSVFIMVRYRNRNAALLASVKRALEENNLNGIVASEHAITDDLYNPVACLLCCSRGIAIFDEPEVNERFNPNVAYELGMVHMLSRSCLILKHDALQTLQTDILMKLYVTYADPAQAAERVHAWAGQRGG